MLKNIRKSKLFLCCISFFFGGTVVGCTLKYAQPNSNILNVLSIFRNEMGNLASQFLNFTPEPNFLSDIAAFEAVIIGLAIPLSMDIISRISERYHSDVISNRFVHEWEVKWLPYLLIVNIILAIFLRFLWPDEPKSILWSISAWIIIILFVLIAIIFILYINKLKKYSGNTYFILEDLYDEANKYFK